MKVLLIEDEPRLNEFLRKGLTQNGFTVDGITNGSLGIEFASTNQYDIIILDLMLPGQNGFEILANLKAFKINTPVIIISALNDAENVIKGLDGGAVDYLKKPFEFGELMARIRAVTRKGDSKTITKYKLGALEVNLLNRKVYFNDMEIILTRREFSLLELLITNCNRIIPKTEISEKIWEVDFDLGSNVIEVHISQLRKKIHEDIIHTRVGIGYYMDGDLIRK